MSQQKSRFDFAQLGTEVRDDLAEFWKPKAPGEALVARVTDRFTVQQRDGTETQALNVAPAVVIAPDGRTGQGYAELAVGLNAQLRRTMAETQAGDFIALEYMGTRDTGAPSPMRTFRTYVLTRERFEAVVQRFAPALALADDKPSAPSDGADVNDLPF